MMDPETATIDMDAATADISASLFSESDAPDTTSVDVPDVPEAPEAPEGTPPPNAEAKPADKPADTPPPEDPTAAYPKSWRKDFAQHWEALPAELKSEIHRREKNFLDGTEQFRQEAAVSRQFSEVFKPYVETMRQHNVNPLALTQNLLATQHVLAFGTPEQKSATLRQIAQQYNVALGEGGEPAAVAPEVADLQRQIAELQSREAQRTRHWQNETRTKVTSEVETFAKDKPYFNDLVTDITRLVQNGEAANLQDAYDKAMWLNPVVRSKELERLQAEKLNAAQTAGAAAAAEAKRQQQLNLRTRTRIASPTARTGSIEDTLKETLRDIESR
jgi:hypothetical protein